MSQTTSVIAVILFTTITTITILRTYQTSSSAVREIKRTVSSYFYRSRVSNITTCTNLNVSFDGNTNFTHICFGGLTLRKLTHLLPELSHQVHILIFIVSKVFFQSFVVGFRVAIS